jgi:hypothetical protein
MACAGLRRDHETTVNAATATALFPHDRVCDWYDELGRVASELPSLPPEARRAVGSVLVSLRREADTELTLTQRRGLDEMLTALSNRA